MKIGILGAGQLARMMILGSKHLGIDFVLFCEKITPTTDGLGKHFEASFSDKEALEKFCSEVDVVTFESENINEETISFVAKRAPLYPSKKSILTGQDRLFEKTLAEKLEIPTNKFQAVNNFEEVKQVSEKLGFPLILKSRRFGYDGKNQYHIQNKEELQKLETENFENFLAESYVPFSHEVSLVGVRSKDGDILTYDICKNHHESGILRKTDNIKGSSLLAEAKVYLERVMKDFDYVGVLAIEFFVKNGDLIFNEMAPRVHNSGHWTIEGTRCSQFENHIRAISGLPLGDTNSISRCEMLNLIGGLPNKGEVLLAGGSFHDYQKAPREGRKLGHITHTLA